MRDCDIKFVNKEITPFGGLSLFFKMLEKCHFEEHVMQSGVPLQPKSVIRISLCRTTQRNPNDRFGLIVKKMRWARICIYLRSLFRFGNRSSSALHVMAGEMIACGMSRSLNAIGWQTPCFFASNPMLLDVKPNAFGRQTQCFWTSNSTLLEHDGCMFS